MEFKEILKDLRTELFKSQKEVADACDLSPQCISQLELGTRSPTGHTLVALADYFDCSIDYLMGRTENYEQDGQFYPMQQTKEQELLNIFRNLSSEYKAQLLDYANYMKERDSVKFDKK